MLQNMQYVQQQNPLKPPKKKSESVKKMGKYFTTSMHHQTGLFFENSTLHGIRYIAENKRPFIERLLWFACIACGTGATFFMISSVWEKFQTNPTITGLDTDFHSWDIAFPAITICPFFPGNTSLIEEYVLDNWPQADDIDDRQYYLGNLTTLNMRILTTFGIQKFIPDDVNLRDLILKLATPCEETFHSCKWKDKEVNCCLAFSPMFTEAGFCWTFNTRHADKYSNNQSAFELKFIEETDNAWSFQLNTYTREKHAKMAIYIHDAEDMPGIDANPQHKWDYSVFKISFSMKQTYTVDDARQLNIRQRKCIYKDEVKLYVDDIYTYTACTRQCRMENSQRLCGCIPYFYKPTGNFRNCPMKDMQCVIDNYKDIKDDSRCNCQLGCFNTVYEVEKLNENVASENAPPLELTFVSWPMVRYKREVLFGWVDLLVSFGGSAGLFLGFSLLSGIELIYYFTIRTCCMVYKNKHDLDKIIMEEEYEKKQRKKRTFMQRLLGTNKDTRRISAVTTASPSIKPSARYTRNITANKGVVPPLRLYSNQNQFPPKERFQGYPREQFIPPQPKYSTQQNQLPVQEINFFNQNDNFYRGFNQRDSYILPPKAPFGIEFLH